ncbi:MAG: HDOD domain-containing protein [Acidimicrobiales bacterium]
MQAAAPRVKDEILTRFENLSPASNVAISVLSFIDRDDIGAADIALVTSADPVLTARIMRMANSAFYGMGGRVATLNTAISLLGLITVRSIAVSAVVTNVASISPDDWLHAIETAAACSVLSSRYGADSATAFSVGMLHDIGRALLREFDPIGYAAIDEITGTTHTVASQDAMRQAEFERYGTTHSALGATILRSWNFPEELCAAIAAHHSESTFAKPLDLALQGGDRLSYLSHLYGARSIHCDEPFDDLLPEGVGADELPQLIEDLQTKSMEIADLFL